MKTNNKINKTHNNNKALINLKTIMIQRKISITTTHNNNHNSHKIIPKFKTMITTNPSNKIKPNQNNNPNKTHNKIKNKIKNKTVNSSNNRYKTPY